MKRNGSLLELEVGSSMTFKQLLQPLLGLVELFSSKLPATLLINSSTSSKNSAPIDLVSPLDFSLPVDSDFISKLWMLCRMLVASFGALIIFLKVPDSSSSKLSMQLHLCYNMKQGENVTISAEKIEHKSWETKQSFHHQYFESE